MRTKGRSLLTIFGTGIVGFWLVMLGLQIQKVSFGSAPNVSGIDAGDAGILAPERNWKEIYLKDRKVGYSTAFFNHFGGDYFIQEELFLKLNLMGLGSALSMVTQCRVDQNFVLKSFNLNMSSGVVRFSMSGKVEGNRLLLETGRGKERQTRTLELQGKPLIGAAVDHYLRSKKLKMGDVYPLPLFDPSSMVQMDMNVKVVARETIFINKIPYEAFRLEGEMWGKKLRFWVDPDGGSLKEEGPMGLTSIKSSAARAPEDLDREMGVDLYDMAAVKVDRSLPDPMRMRSLKLKLEGIDPGAFPMEDIGGKRQKFHDGILELKKEEVPLTPSYRLPRNDWNEETKTFLEPEFNIESDDRELIEQALRIAKDLDNPRIVAQRLLDWVYEKLEKRPVLSLPSAKEVLRTRVGDCNEHATLLTALLRATGIPARICIGLVYTRGKFYYHAWTEAYLGEWVSMDATLNQMPTDVTHIKLLQGNLDKQAQIAGLIGELKIEVLDFKYD